MRHDLICISSQCNHPAARQPDLRQLGHASPVLTSSCKAAFATTCSTTGS